MPMCHTSRLPVQARIYPRAKPSLDHQPFRPSVILTFGSADVLMERDGIVESSELVFLADPAVRVAALRRALSMVRSRDDAEDAVQEAAVRALRYRASLRSGAPGKPWFMRIVSRAALDIIARRNRLQTTVGEHVSTAPDSGATILALERSHMIRSALATLPAAQRRAVILHDVDGFTARLIAAREHVPASTVRTRLRRGRLALRSALAEQVAA